MAESSNAHVFHSSIASIGRSGTQPTSTVATPLLQDETLLEEDAEEGLTEVVERTLRTFTPYVNPLTRKGKAVGLCISVAGCVLEQSGSSAWCDDLAGTSTVYKEASRHLDTILRATHASDCDRLGFVQYLNKLDRLPNQFHELQDTDSVAQFSSTREEWHLISLAAHSSKQAYGDLATVAAAWKLEPNQYSNLKPTTISLNVSEGRRVLIVSIRGSASLRDWVVNANGAQVRSRKLIDGETSWHRGFLVVAKAMQKAVAKAIDNITTSNDAGPIDDLIFTGHSAGGAIAQIFYAMNMRTEYEMSSIAPGFTRIHCITFGCPPVATTPITPPVTLGTPQPGLFLNIINEGDPVPLAQRGYVKSLLEVYTLTEDEFNERYPRGFRLPQPIFRISGQCIVLQDAKPEDPADNLWRAVRINASILEGKLFGNPLLHLMGEYIERVDALATAAGYVREVPSTTGTDTEG